MILTDGSLGNAERERLRILTADAFGLMAAGMRAPGLSEILSACTELGHGDIAVPYTGRYWSAPGAAIACSGLIHGWDFDDTHDQAVVHTATVAIPAALIAAQLRSRTGSSFARGVIVGIHILARLAEFVGPRRGVIRTAGLGALAAAGAVAATWGLDAAGIENAMSLAVGGALGPASRQAVADSSIAKRVQPGLAVQAGLAAAALGAYGIEGPRGWLAGEWGLVPGAEVMVADVLVGPFAGLELAIKPYPACRFGHSAIAAAEALFHRHGAQHTDRLVVHLPKGSSYAMVARPYASRGEPIIDAQFSVPWQIASIWVTGRYDVTTLAGPDVGDPSIAAAAAAIEVRQDLPTSTIMDRAIVDLHRDDAVYTAEAPMPGGPDAPPDRDAVTAKLHTCFTVAGLSPDAEATRLWEFVDQMETLDATMLQCQLADFVHARQPAA